MNTTDKLDLILNKISDVKDFIASKDLYEQLKEKIDAKEFTPIVGKLFMDGFVEKKILDDDNNSRLTPPFFCRLTFSGMMFLEDGGYTKQMRRKSLNNAWMKTKLVANILNAVLVLLIAAAGVYVTIDSNKKDIALEKKNVEIENLKANLNRSHRNSR